MFFAIAQFHILNISNGGISGEIYKFLLECYCCVAQLQKLAIVLTKINKIYYMYIYIYNKFALSTVTA